MFARLRLLVLVTFACAIVPARAHAQQVNDARSAAAAGPRLELTATAVRQLTKIDSATALTLAAQRKNVGRPVALMIVGGAAIVIGAVIGGDVGTLFMVGGAVAGLFGLYQYLQ